MVLSQTKTFKYIFGSPALVSLREIESNRDFQIVSECWIAISIDFVLFFFSQYMGEAEIILI